MIQKPENNLQQQFVQHIKDLIPENESFVDILADLLEISTDSAYRRIRGETAMTIDEVSVLCNHFKISFDTFSYTSSENVTFSYNLMHDIGGFKLYLKAIRDDMMQIAKTQNNKIIYTAVDVPIFHHFNYPMLAAFKFYYWLKAVVNEPTFENRKFEKSLIDQETTDLGKDIYRLYSQIPSVEIWSDSSINSLLKQIEFFWESGWFQSNDDAQLVVEEVYKEVEILSKQTEEASKVPKEFRKLQEENNFQLYKSEIEIGNNSIFVQRGAAKVVYLSIHTFNKMVTASKRFAEETEFWHKNLMRKSLLLSGVSEKQRLMFFRNTIQKIDVLYNKVKKGL